MLATFVIGLREGLEAALIVGIIAAFLRNNGKSLRAMWVGVGLAGVLSIAVGIGLDLVEQALPQAAQEGMETVIGAIAIFFVTGMIVWMNQHARHMKRELESQAAEALGQTSAFALAAMAFLAVLKEGFETAVFLLATFSAAQSAALAATGAILGIGLAIVIGWGIYAGGVKINLSRFFQVTGAFLILVAAGLVITALRTAHEAGWLNAGQQATFNLSWLVAPGTIQSALITGVLGIPADPRLLELIGWLAYLLPVALYVYWPQTRRLSALGAVRLRCGIAAGLGILSLALAIGIPAPQPHPPAEAPVLAEGNAAPLGTAQLRHVEDGHDKLSVLTAPDTTLILPPNQAQEQEQDGVSTLAWHITQSTMPENAPDSLTLDQLVALSGGRIPVGLNPSLHPGPYTAHWRGQQITDVWTANGLLLDAAQHSRIVLTLSGSGLSAPRTLNVSGSGWGLSPAYTGAALAALVSFSQAQQEHQFWAVQLPALLALTALLLAAATAAKLRRLRRTSTTNTAPKGIPHAAE
jgi:high-affinity iron transporter